MHASVFSSLRRPCALVLLLAGGAATLAAADSVELVSRVDPGALSDTAASASYPMLHPPSISRDGRYVAFLSTANNLAPGQVDRSVNTGQQANDVFLYDRVARTTTLVSHDAGSSTVTGNAESIAPVISADGRWVVYSSSSTNLVDGLPDGPAQVRLYLYDRVSGNTTLVSSSAAFEASLCGGCGVLNSAISADGRFVAYTSPAPDLVPGQQDGNEVNDVFLYDRTTGKTVLVSHAGTPASTVADSSSPYLSMSADGRFIAFNRRPINTPGGRPGDGDVLLYDRLSAAITPIAPGGAPTISADGAFVGFLSAGRQVIPGQIDANGFGADVFLYSRATRGISLVSHAAGRPTTTGNGAAVLDLFYPVFPLVSADGRYVAFASLATNLVPRQATPGGALFLYDRTSGSVILASRRGNSPSSGNTVRTATMSADGRFIAFDASATDQVPGQIDFNYGLDIFLFDRKTGTTILVSSRSGAARGSFRNTGNGPAYTPAISADGSQLAFHGTASDLVAGVRDFNNGEDLFLYTVAARTSAVASLHPPGMASVSPDGDSFLRGLSADGRWTLFEGSAANLVPGQVDGNSQSDVFLYDHTTRKSLLASHASASPTTAGDGASYQGSLSADGRWAAFTSYATNLDPGVTDYSDPSTTQRRFDVFLFDRVTGKNLALSRSARHPGLTGDFDSSKPVISADGRWVAFLSSATDLVPASSTGTGNVYLYDRVAGVLTRTNASITTVGAARPLALSADGRYLLTLSRTGFSAMHTVVLYDRVTRTNTLVSHDRAGAAAGVGQDQTPVLSADGRFVAFCSSRNDLGEVPGLDLNTYLWDRESGGVTLLGGSTRSNVPVPPCRSALSADGRWVAFLSNADTPAPGFTNPARTSQVVLYDRVAGTSTLVTSSVLVPGQGSQGGAADPAISPDGRHVAYVGGGIDLVPGQTGSGSALYLYDRIAGTTIPVTPLPAVYSFLGGFNPSLSADGRSVAFESGASGLVPRDFNGFHIDVFLFTRTP
jgi:Tol biopolymer transport system component